MWCRYAPSKVYYGGFLPAKLRRQAEVMDKQGALRVSRRLLPVDPVSALIQGTNMQEDYGVVVNISELGACIVSSKHFQPRTSVGLSISFYRQSQLWTAESTVVWARVESDCAECSVTHGLRFLLSLGDQRHLHDILRSCRLREAPLPSSTKSRDNNLANMLMDLSDDLTKLGAFIEKTTGRIDETS